jgi:hypothetical protein
MDILKMLAELRTERQHIEEAILVMELLAIGNRGRRRGRPPKWMSEANPKPAPSAAAKKRVMSAATRKRMAAAQKKRWALKKAQALQLGP